MTERAKPPQGMPHSAYFSHTVRRAYSIAARRASAVVGLEHFLFALLDDPDALALMEGCDTDIASLRVELGKAIENATPREILGNSEQPQAGKPLRHLLQVAQRGARESGRREVDGAIAVAALAGQSDSPLSRLLSRHGLSFGKALGWIDTQATNAAVSPPAPLEARQAERAPAPQQPPAPQRSAARQSQPPPRPKPPERPKPEPSLEDMLATIRDVIDEDDGPAAPTPQEPPAAPPRKPPESARAPAQRRRPPANSASAGAEPHPPARRRANGVGGPQSTRRAVKKPPESKKPKPPLEKLAERIPRAMRERAEESVEIRIAREQTDSLIAGMQNEGPEQNHGALVTRAMSLYLRAPDGGFMIEPLMPETQWIFDRPSFLDSEPFGQWQWTVLPMTSGSRTLQLYAAARSIDENGMIADVALPEQLIEVRVQMNWARQLRRAALWAGLVIAGGVLAQVLILGLPGLFG